MDPKIILTNKAKYFKRCTILLLKDPYLFKFYTDEIIRRCVPEIEMNNILSHFHDGTIEGHCRRRKTFAEVLEVDFSDLLFSKMKEIISPLATNVREVVTFKNVS